MVELVLEKTPVHVPDVYDVIDTSYVSYSLKKFCFVGEMSSLLVHDFLTRGIAFYMPELIELEVQPQTVTGYGGLFPCQVNENLIFFEGPEYFFLMFLKKILCIYYS